MCKYTRIALAAALASFCALSGFAKSPSAAKAGEGTIVIVFKDGHRQTFNLADIERVEFPSPNVAANLPSDSLLPPRFIGRWKVGDGSGNDFYITLKEGGSAMRSLGDVHGHWVYFNGEAQITWDDGAQDAIRRVGSHYEKRAFAAGKTFTDEPDNVTGAQNTTPHPI
ncbi:MAG TPA: hypothetical protein VL967_08835 [Terracidiphilus sp.]|nr:hypothetical protein [Terracidiphilus sp.]